MADAVKAFRNSAMEGLKPPSGLLLDLKISEPDTHSGVLLLAGEYIQWRSIQGLDQSSFLSPQ